MARQAVVRMGGFSCAVALVFTAAALYLAGAATLDSHVPGDRDGTTAIAVGQAGYAPRQSKHALVTAEDARAFTVHDDALGHVVLEGALSEARLDADTGMRVRDADFTSLDKPGRYHVRVPGVGRSWAFDVGVAVYERPLYLATRSFYGQRCGTPVALGPGFEAYRHGLCHTVGRFDTSTGRSGRAPSVKGWHDAGDYGRYMVTSGIATGLLLLATDLYPARLLSLRLDIPESGSTTPDVLEEVRWNLEWMRSMQDADGGVWHKQTSATFADVVLPDDDLAPSLIIGSGRHPFKTTCATAQFAATMAMAARVFRPWDDASATVMLAAARRAWDWTTVHPDERFSNPKGITTGEYGDASCDDDRLWAAVELWRTTRDAARHDVARALVAQRLDAVSPTTPPSWTNVAPLALWSYALDGGGDAALTGDIRRRVVAAADAVASRVRAHPFRHPLTKDDFVWGSNGVAATYGVQLLVADRLSLDPAASGPLLEAALDTLHYLLGRNAFSLSWVSHVGANAVRHLHHRPSAAQKLEAPWPGLLAGGPNGQREDPVLDVLPISPPGLTYVDDEGSFASNEYAINWNAPLVLLLAGAADTAERERDVPRQ